MKLSGLFASRQSAEPFFETLVLGMLATASWLATHRYPGLWHDAILYAAQAIYRLDPVPFAKDLFFAYGSQDGFTVFTPFYALVIAIYGLPTASKLLLVIAHLGWVLAVAFLLRAIFSDRNFWAALVFVAVVPPAYGPFDVFSYAESFLTARSWAEPWALLAVAFILRGHRAAAIACLAFAAAVHPVMAFPAALFLFLFGFRGRQQLLLGLAGVAAVAVLTAVAVPPFTGLAQFVDPVWLGLLMDRSPILFLDLWPSNALWQPVFLSLLLTTAALVAAPENRRLWWSALGVLLVGMGLALLVLWWPAVLLVQMQPWRVLWLVKILAIAAAIALVRDTWSASPFSRILLGALLACIVSLDSSNFVYTVPLFMLVVARKRWGLDPRLSPWTNRMAWSVVALVVGKSIFWAASLSAISLDFTVASFSSLSLADRLSIICKESGWFLFPPLLLGSWWLLRHYRRAAQCLTLLLGLVVLFFAVQWQQTSYSQTAEDRLREAGQPELARLIQPNQLTYWGDGHARLWLVLHRGSYASSQQAAGIVFSRQTAVEAERRLARVRRLGLSDSKLKKDAAPETKEQPAEVITQRLDGLIHVCHDPILDFVVLSQKVRGVIPTTTVTLYPGGPEYRLYACADLRMFPDPFPSSL